MHPSIQVSHARLERPLTSKRCHSIGSLPISSLHTSSLPTWRQAEQQQERGETSQLRFVHVLGKLKSHIAPRAAPARTDPGHAALRTRRAGSPHALQPLRLGYVDARNLIHSCHLEMRRLINTFGVRG